MSFFVNDHEYTHTSIDAFTQFFICRQTSTIFIELNAKGLDAPNAFEVLASVPEDRMDAVIKRILPFVQRKTEQGTWTPIYVSSVNQLLFPDIDGITLIRIVFEILMEYLTPFFSGFDLLISGNTNPNQQENGQPQTTNI